MKKILAFLLAFSLLLCLTACGNDPESAATTEKPAATETEPETAPATEPATEAAIGETTGEATGEATGETGTGLAAGDTGVGPVTLDTPFYTIEVPAGLEYKVYTWYFDEESNLGTIELGFLVDGNVMESVGLLFNTGIMASSYEEAVEESIKLRNLDTYEEGKYELGEETTYGPLTYQAFHTSTEYGEEDWMVSYLDFHGSSVTVQVSDRFASGLIFDPMITELLSGMVLK